MNIQKQNKYNVLNILRLVIGIIKLPLFMLLFFLSFINYIISLILPYNRYIRFIEITFDRILSKLTLIIAGYFTSPIQPTQPLRMFSSSSFTEKILPGDFIICNFSSYFNLFLLQLEFAPIFTFPVDENHVVLRSLHQIFIRQIFNSKLEYNDSVVFAVDEIVERAKYDGAPIVIFPETEQTNGKYLNNFKPLKYPENQRLFMIGIENPVDLHPDFSKSNSVLQLINLLGRFLGRMRGHILVNAPVPRESEKQKALMSQLLGIQSQQENESNQDTGPDFFQNIHESDPAKNEWS